MKEDTTVYHPYFGTLQPAEVNTCLDFLAHVMHQLEGFEVWENEHFFVEETKWDQAAVQRFENIRQFQRVMDKIPRNEFNIERFLATARELGIDVTTSSTTPGIYQKQPNGIKQKLSPYEAMPFLKEKKEK